MAREEERRRLRRDLHDGLGSALASLSFNLDAARNFLSRDPDATDALLVELKSQTQGAIADIRRLINDLRPPAIDELGLVPALQQYVDQVNRPASLSIAIQMTNDLPPLPAAVEVAAYRIILEALTNIIRHSNAKHCSIRLSLANQAWLGIEIVDDGEGISTAKQSGIGLANMRDRAEELGGSFRIEANPSGGTRVDVGLPLPI
jgi:signal transduction histidine kinase